LHTSSIVAAIQEPATQQSVAASFQNHVYMRKKCIDEQLQILQRQQVAKISLKKKKKGTVVVAAGDKKRNKM